MAITKRLRFEIFRRDGFACRYCGAKDRPLEPDHVIPKALGGSDLPENLLTACVDCNEGKGSTLLNGPTLPDIRIPGPSAASLARELLGDAASWELKYMLNDVAADEGDIGEDETYIEALRRAYRSAVAERDALHGAAQELQQRILPQGWALDSSEEARAKLYAEHGPLYSPTQYDVLVTELLCRRMDADYLDGLPADEADAWHAYARTVIGLNPTDGPASEDEIFLAAAMAREATGGRPSARRGMCQAGNGDGPAGLCPRPFAFRYVLDGCRWKHFPIEDKCDGHDACEDHLEALVSGRFSWIPDDENKEATLIVTDYWSADPRAA